MIWCILLLIFCYVFNFVYMAYGFASNNLNIKKEDDIAFSFFVILFSPATILFSLFGLLIDVLRWFLNKNKG